MNKFKCGDTVLPDGIKEFDGRNVTAKVVAVYDDCHYVIETSNGFIYNVPEEALTMHKIHYSKYYKNNPVNLSYLLKRVVFSDMATVVIWGDGTKTIVRKQDGDVYDPEKAIAMCFMKQVCQKNKLSMNDIFEKWIDENSPKN